jgi:hypothetical protein
MAEIIYLREIRAERRRGRVANREHLERAVQLLIENLADAGAQLAAAPTSEQGEFLDRVEKLAALIRYGRRMRGEEPDAPLAGRWTKT